MPDFTLTKSTIIETLLANGLELPEPAKAAASYVPFIEHGGMLYLSGQLPIDAKGNLIKGRLGDDLQIEDGQQAARLSGAQILAQTLAALKDDLTRLDRCLSMRILVASTKDFFDHHLVANGASNLLEECLKESGIHTRAAFGVPALPLNAAVEIEAIFALKT